MPETTDTIAADEQAPTPAKAEEITLETPIVRGTTTIRSLQLHKPDAGKLRGLKLQDLLQSDVNSVIALLPRIADPKVLAEEAARLDPVDLAACAGAIQGFFMSKADQATLAQFMGLTEESKN